MAAVKKVISTQKLGSRALRVVITGRALACRIEATDAMFQPDVLCRMRRYGQDPQPSRARAGAPDALATRAPAEFLNRAGEDVAR